MEMDKRSNNLQERRQRILTQIYKIGHVSVRDLAQDMTVSEATVRRDLHALAANNQLEVVYGGASLPRFSDFSFRSKSLRNVGAKRVIGRLAATLVSDDEQLLVDSGTTCFEMIQSLKSRRGLSIIVNSARLALELGQTRGLNVIMLGGLYRPDRMDAVGPLATATLDQLRGYLAFIGADGLSMEFGVAASDIESAHLYRLAVCNGRETILLVDHTKFDSASLFKIVDWDFVSRVVTDQRPRSEWTQFLEGKGIDLIYPDEDSTEPD